MKHSTLFIDESGKSSLVDEVNKAFILTGVILDDEDLKTVEGFFSYIKRKYDIDLDKPFHSYDLFENPSTKISSAKAKPLLSAVADFISIIPIQINIVEVNKEIFKKALGVKSNEDFKGDAKRLEMKEFPYRIMSANLFGWFAKYLHTSDGIGQIIVDSRKGGDSQLIKSLSLCKGPNAPINTEESKLIKERCSAICFAEKNFLSCGLEITDLISYASFFHVRRMMNSMKEYGLPKVWLEVKKKLPNAKINKLQSGDIKTFFKIGRGEVYKALKEK